MRQTVRVIIRGETFETVQHAAETFGVAKSTVYCALSRGNPDSIGLRRGTRPKESHKSGRGREFTIAGVTFPSIAAASEALGFRRRYLADALVKGRTETRQRIAFAALRYTARQEMAAMRAASGKEQVA